MCFLLCLVFLLSLSENIYEGQSTELFQVTLTHCEEVSDQTVKTVDGKMSLTKLSRLWTVRAHDPL